MRIKVRFSAQAKPLSLLIRWWTFSPFSHVEFVLPDGQTLGSRFPAGVQTRPPMKYSRVVDIALEIEPAAYLRILNGIGARYDFLSLTFFPLPGGGAKNGVAHLR